MNNKPIHSAKYSASEVAAYIISKIYKDGTYITWLHMDGLLYFAQAYNFVLYGKPLFYNDIYVSEYVIQIENLHEGNHVYSGMIIKNHPLLKGQKELDEEDKRNINDLLETLRNYSNADLVKIIMKQEIWRKARSQGLNALIPKEDFRKCFYKKQEEEEEEEKPQVQFHSKSKRYRIKPKIVKNFFGVCTIISSIILGLGIDMWIVQNVCSQLVVCNLLLKVITLMIIIHYVCKDDHEGLEETIASIEEKLRLGLFEEVD